MNEKFLNLAPSRDAYNKYVVAKSRLCGPNEFLFVVEWLTVDDRVYARGMDVNHEPAVFKLPVRTGLVVATKHPSLFADLEALARVQIVQATKWPGVNLRTVSHTLVDLWNGEREQEFDHVWHLQTASFAEAKKLHRALVECKPLLNRVVTFGTWTLELFVNLNQHTVVGRTGNIFNVHMNSKFLVDETATPILLPVVSFDIETVSTKDTRVPMGDHMNDVLFSLSICTSDGQIINAFNVPARYNESLPDGTRIFNSEADLLRFVFKFFLEAPGVYFCTGYNVVWYDLSFICRRAMYLGLDDLLQHVHWANGMPCIGHRMVVVDLMAIVSKFFAEMFKTNMKLKTILATLLNDVQKVDLEAVNLRYVYRDLVHGPNLKTEWPEYDITLDKAVRYNFVDAHGVLCVWKKFQLENFVQQGAQSMNVNLARFAVSKVGEYLSTNFLLDCFTHGALFTIFKPDRVTGNDGTLIRYNFNKLGSTSQGISASLDEEQKISFGGGFNYRSGMGFHRTVQMMDMVCYYPYLIEGFNLAHETCVLLTKAGLVRYAEVAFTDAYTVHVFCSHKFMDDDGLAIMSQLYVKGLVDNVPQLTSVQDLDLYKDDDRFVVICKTRGVLPTIIAQQNKSRSDLKRVTKQLKKLTKQIKKLKPVSQTSLTQQDLIHRATSLYEPGIKILKDKDLGQLGPELASWYQQQATVEHDRLFGLFRNLKIVNNSFYGFTYSDHGCVQGKHVASIVTLFGRKFIIESARQSEAAGYQCVFMDTDSIFVCPQPGIKVLEPETIREGLLAINPKLDLNHKTYDDLLVLAKKVYFATSPKGLICRGITRNGPALWSEYMFRLYESVVKLDQPVYGTQVAKFLESVYEETYQRLQTDRSIILCSQSCKQLQDYRTNIPMKRLLQRYHDEQQVTENPSRMNFWFGQKGSVEDTHLNFEHELATAPLQDLNLFKFYQTTFGQLYNLFNAKIVETCRRDGYNFGLSLSAFNALALRIYLDVRSRWTLKPRPN